MTLPIVSESTTEHRILSTRTESTSWAPIAEEISVVLLASVVLGVIVIQGLLVDRPVGVEEVVLFNAAYMFAHTGSVTFPAYAFLYGQRMFETLGLHPHVHYAIVGGLLRLGIGIRAAEAVPVLFMSLLTAWLLVRSRVDNRIKVGVLFGMAAGVSLALLTTPDEVFSARPEYDVAATWLAGLVALETARQAAWDVRRLFAGAFLITVASGMQWFAIGGFVGTAVYAIVALRELGWRAARSRLLAIALGGGLFGVPYIVFFVIPNWDVIHTVMNIGWNCSTCAPDAGIWSSNAAVYRHFFDVFHSAATQGTMLFTAGPLALVLASGLPAFVVGLALLLLVRGARAFALAATALPLWAYLAANHKDYYYSPEFLMTSIAVGVLLMSIVVFIVRRLSHGRLVWLGVSAAMPVLAFAVVAGSPELRSISPTIPPSPMDVARAAGKTIVGPAAVVTTPHQLWYLSGARYWYDFTTDMQRQPISGAGDYFSAFDAVAETPYPWFSIDVLEQFPRRSIVPALYADGQLQLLGFYSDQYSYTVFSGKQRGRVLAYARRGRTLYRFSNDATAGNGDHVLATLVCPAKPLVTSPEETYTPDHPDTANIAFTISEQFIPFPWSEVDPATNRPMAPNAPAEEIRALVVPRATYAASRQSLIAGCRVRDEVIGNVVALDAFEFGARQAPGEDLVTPYFAAADALEQRKSEAPLASSQTTP
jgi:hypothetical protein